MPAFHNHANPLCVHRGLDFRRHLPLYVGLFLAILPVIVIASFTAPFQHTYPFYKLAVRSWTDLIAWELLYVLSFFALEFFFRGFTRVPPCTRSRRCTAQPARHPGFADRDCCALPPPCIC